MQFAFLGTQPLSYAASLAQQRAFQQTAQLASSEPGAAATSSILAATSAGGATAAAPPPAPIDALRQSAVQACGVGGDAHACCLMNQQLGMQDVAAQCHVSTHVTATRAAAAKSRGSITDLWFKDPSWVSPVNPTTQQTAAVAVSLTAV
jgi:hypothetical protein